MLIIPPLEDLGPRICIFGPSNAGKSTLCTAIGSKLAIDAVHLDILYHQPNTNWVPRPKEEFAAGHAAAIAGDRWVMDGNYMGQLSQRMSRATGIVLLGTDRWSAFARYLRRTLFERGRPGNLPGAQDSLKWDMVNFILIEQPRKRRRDVGLLRATGLPMVQFNSIRDLNAAYAVWDLERTPIAKT